MPAPDWYGPVFGFLGGGTIVSLVTLWIQRRKFKAERLDAEAGTASRLFEEVRKLRADWLEEKAAREDCDRRCVELHGDLKRLKVVLPSVLLDSQISKLTPALLAVLNGSSDTDCWVISTPVDGATWIFVNAAMCRALKMTLTEILLKGWRALIAPEDLSPTLVIETGQWGETVTCVNTYIASDGTRVKLRWLGMRYAGGMALSLARVVK